MLFIFSAKSNLQHWGKPSGSTPIFYEKISRLVVIFYNSGKQFIEKSLVEKLF
jgi:hypothetical protein